MLRPGIRVYRVDTETRRLVVLPEVTRGGSFPYRSKTSFSRKVRELTGRSPDPREPYGSRLPSASSAQRPCTGLALRWKVVKRVSIPLDVRFKQLGWLRLTGSGSWVEGVGLQEQFLEGDRYVRRHLLVERSRRLRSRSIAYWGERLGELRCLACGFSFADRYGALGAGFIEMHHDRPLSQGRRATRVTDLKPPCANCHRMVHRSPGKILAVSQRRRSLTRWSQPGLWPTVG